MQTDAQKLYFKLASAINEMPDAPMCADEDKVELFFPEYKDGDPRISTWNYRLKVIENEAKVYCNLCPVKALCANYAIEGKEEYGIWGGTTAAERYAIYRGRATKPQWIEDEL